MAKRSKAYIPHNHGTGWPSGHPTDAEVRFLDNPNVVNTDKVKFITSSNAKPPASLQSPTAQSPPPPPPGLTPKPVATTTAQEQEVGLGGIVTSHYIINYSKTGFPIRRFKINYPKVNVTIA